MLNRFPFPVLGFAAHSGTGKTTLLCEIIPQLRARGARIGVIKHAHHDFDIDIPGKDSYELRKAGAMQMLVASPHRQALIRETPDGLEPELNDLLERLDAAHLDLVLVEGFKKQTFPKIELYRPSLGFPLLCRTDNSIIAIATDEPIADHPAIPILDLNRPKHITEFIIQTFFISHDN